MRLILIEDNHRLAESIGLGLEADGFAVDRFDTLASARAALDRDFPMTSSCSTWGCPTETASP